MENNLNNLYQAEFEDNRFNNDTIYRLRKLESVINKIINRIEKISTKLDKESKLKYDSSIFDRLNLIEDYLDDENKEV